VCSPVTGLGTMWDHHASGGGVDGDLLVHLADVFEVAKGDVSTTRSPGRAAQGQNRNGSSVIGSVSTRAVRVATLETRATRRER
jgi:hypothetical protein